ncbi:uncharacterized protein GGS22DRAFT_164343 [Annulohypoxylon maeteangense]|uniref:uncharacterized protein n=1 Tax=Annulohypoxylon maeteangense TaxID=1927788 RepID=UPI00200895E3|nr:uncharacterized protein GGS22DRAFT_164343 [Annulohypoxylon maeteangense]KAI0884787.1 hypothetical protein GGS22DRAFT_164343 [Annulohypoxylon maeteangense]
MDDDNDYGGHRLNPNCQRVDLSRITTRELVYHVASSIAGLRNDYPDRFEQLEQVVQGESNDWKEILEDIGKNLEFLQSTLDDCQEGQEGADGVKALLRIVEDHITDMQTDQDRLLHAIVEFASANQSRVESMNDSVSAQMSALRAEVQALRRTISQTPRFPQFRRLPAEVRFMIWDLALPRRMVGLKESFGNDTEEFDNPRYEFISKLPPPSVAQVCRESRAIACQSGRLVSIRNSPVYLPSCLRVQWTWFDSSRDSLFFRLSMSGYSLHPIRDLTSRAQHVTIDYETFDDDVYNFFESLFTPSSFPQLKTIDIVGETYTQPERSDPVLESRVFTRDCNHPISIEKHNQSVKKAFLRKLKTNHSSDDVDQLERFLEAKGNTDGLPHDNIHYDTQAWHDRLKQLHDRWLINQYEGGASGGDVNGGRTTSVRVNEKEKVGPSYDWLVMMNLKIPTIRRVALLRLRGDGWNIM